MKQTIRIEPAGVSFEATPQQTILQAAIEAGIVLPHSCLRGDCDTCRVEVLSGTVCPDETPGVALSCSVRPVTDLVLAVDFLPELAGIDCHVLPVKVQHIRRVEDVLVISLGQRGDATLDFRAGQYVDLIYQGVRRSYSIASAPGAAIELHVRVDPNGSLSPKLERDLAVGSLLHVEGPRGTFIERAADSEHRGSVLLLATGTGIAPLKSILCAHLLPRLGDGQRISLYWGNRSAADFYEQDFEAWADRFPGFEYIPVVSRPDRDWKGRTGHVQDALLKDGHDLGAARVLACGSQAMCESAQVSLVAAGLPVERYRADAFVATE